jgi:hypothetical protein
MSGQGGRRSTFSSGLRPIPVKITRQRTALKDDGSSLGPWPRIPVASPGFLLAQPGFQPIFILGAGPSEYRVALSARLHGGKLLVVDGGGANYPPRRDPGLFGKLNEILFSTFRTSRTLDG